MSENLVSAFHLHLQVADRWEAYGLLTAASDAMCGLTSTFPTLEVFLLPEVLRATAGYSAVLAAASDQLVVKYANAHTILTSHPLLREFVAMPIDALTSLLQHPSFVTDAEESVLLLVRCWCQIGVYGKECTLTNLMDLNKHIRYSRLYAPHAVGLCPVEKPPSALPPAQPEPPMAAVLFKGLPQLLPGQLAELLELKSLPTGILWPTTGLCCPKEWYLPARSSHSNSNGAHLTLTVSLDDLKGVLARTHTRMAKSTAVYAEGFLWTLRFGLNGKHIFCSVAAHGVVSPMYTGNGTSRVNLKRGVPASYSMQIDAATGPSFILSPPGVCMLISSSGSGVKLGVEGHFQEASDIAWWAPYINKGGVCFSAVITK